MPFVPPDATAAPDALRLLVGALGGLSLLFGARLYKPALLGSAFSVGAVGVFVVAAWLPPQWTTGPGLWVAALVCGVAIAVVAATAHRVALVAIGAVVGALVGLALASSLALPLWVPLIGAVVGAVVFPWTFKPLLKLLTPAVGAALICWAAGLLDSIGVIVALYVLGVVVQLATGGPPERKRTQDAD